MAESVDITNQILQNEVCARLDNLEDIASYLDRIASGIDTIVHFMSDEKGGENKESETSTKAANGIGGIDLGKLDENVEALAKSLAAFNILAGGGTKFVKFIGSLSKALTMNGEIKNPKEIGDLYVGFGKAMESIGSSMASMAGGMILFSVASIMGGPKAYIKFFDDFFTDERMDKFTSENAIKFGKNLVKTGQALKNFAKSMFMLTPAMLLAIPGLAILLPAALIIKGASALLGDEASVNMIYGMAKGIGYFGIGLLAFTTAAIITRFIQPTDLLMLVGIIGVYLVANVALALVDALVGGPDGSADNVKGILYFCAGIALFELAALGTRLLTDKDLSMVKGIVTTLTIVTLLMTIVGPKAESGAKAMIIISASLIVAEIAVFMIDALGIKPKSYLIAAGMLTALAAATIIVGINAEFAIPGAIAMLLISTSVMITAISLKKISEIDAKNALKGVGVILPMGLAFAALAPIAVFAGIGAGVGLAMGAALFVIGAGLKKFASLDVPVDELTGEKGTIAKILNSVITPFEELGKKYTFSSIKDFILGTEDPLTRGINMCKGLGEILCDIASGVKEFSKLEFKNSKGELVTMADGDFELVAKNLEKVITCVSNAFIKVGNDSQYDLGFDPKASMGQNIFKAVSGLASGTPLQRAISNLSGIGEILCDIASGVKEFSKLEFKNSKGELVTMADGDFKLVAKNLEKVITCVSNAFIEAGKGNGTGVVAAAKEILKGNVTGMLDALGDSPLEKSIASFSGISEISGGIIDIFDKLGKDSAGVDSKTIQTNIQNVLTGMVNGLTSLTAESVETLEKKQTFVKKVSGAIVDIAKNADGLEKSANALEKICNSLDKSFNKINELAENKLENVKLIFDELVKLEEKESERIEQKMESFKNMANGVEGNVSSSYSIETAPQKSNVTTSDAGKQTKSIGNVPANKQEDNDVASLAQAIASLQQRLTEISTKLSGTLNVAIEDDGFSGTTFRR